MDEELRDLARRVAASLDLADARALVEALEAAESGDLTPARRRLLERMADFVGYEDLVDFVVSEVESHYDDDGRLDAMLADPRLPIVVREAVRPALAAFALRLSEFVRDAFGPPSRLSQAFERTAHVGFQNALLSLVDRLCGDVGDELRKRHPGKRRNSDEELRSLARRARSGDESALDALVAIAEGARTPLWVRPTLVGSRTRRVVLGPFSDVVLGSFETGAMADSGMALWAAPADIAHEAVADRGREPRGSEIVPLEDIRYSDLRSHRAVLYASDSDPSEWRILGHEHLGTAIDAYVGREPPSSEEEVLGGFFRAKRRRNAFGPSRPSHDERFRELSRRATAGDGEALDELVACARDGTSSCIWVRFSDRRPYLQKGACVLGPFVEASVIGDGHDQGIWADSGQGPRLVAVLAGGQRGWVVAGHEEDGQFDKASFTTHSPDDGEGCRPAGGP